MYPVNSKKGLNALYLRQASPSVFKLYRNDGKEVKFNENFDVEAQSHVNLKEVVKKNFEEYCNTATVHGVRYIGQRKRIEKFLWTIICILLFCGCGTQIYEIVGKWRKSPLVFLLDTKESRIQEIDFPAVTICPQRLPNRQRFNYTNFLKRFLYEENMEIEEEEMMLFDVITKICFRRLLKYLAKIEPYVAEIPTYKHEELMEVMEEYFLPTPLKLFYCTGIVPDRDYWDCNLRFTPIWLKEGLCYSFNLLPKEEIFREGVEYPLADKPNLVLPKDEPGKTNSEDYTPYLEEQESTYRVFTRRDRLHVRTRFYEDFTDLTCSPDFFVFIHRPHEIPWDRQSDGYLIQVEEFVKNVLTVTPSVVRTDTKLQKSFKPEERGCYFEDERPLKFFKKYSQSNCELECVVNASFSEGHFNCTAFWMPRTPEMPLCRFEFYLLWYYIDSRAKEDLLECDCLTDCNDITYEVAISSSHTPMFDDTAITKEDAMQYETDEIAQQWVDSLQKKLFVGKNRSYNFEIPIREALNQTNLTVDFDIWKWKYSEIEVHYENSEFLAMKRVQAYSFADFVSQIGGILGCFLGISIFSIIELGYFCTVRMMKQVKQQNREEKKSRIPVICMKRAKF